jgi:hypothetical protein
MGFNKETAGKLATYIGYTVYVLTVIYGAFLIFADPTTLYGEYSPSAIQIGGLLLIAYGIIQVAVTVYNRLPPAVPKTAEQIIVDKSKMRDRNDKKSKERKQE